MWELYLQVSNPLVSRASSKVANQDPPFHLLGVQYQPGNNAYWDESTAKDLLSFSPLGLHLVTIITNMLRACLIVLVVACFLSSLTSAVKFDLHAVAPANIESGKRCLSHYVPKDTLVLATVNVGTGYNQRVDLEVKIAKNVYMIAWCIETCK